MNQEALKDPKDTKDMIEPMTKDESIEEKEERIEVSGIGNIEDLKPERKRNDAIDNNKTAISGIIGHADTIFS